MSAPYRVLIVTKSTAGVAEYVRWLVNGLDRDQFALTVACLSENGPEFAAELEHIPGVHAFSLDMQRYQIDPLSDFRVAWQLRTIIRRERFDLVHANASKPGFLARWAALGSAVPVIFSPHCFAFHAGIGQWQAKILAGLEGFAARFLTARILTVANGERELARQYQVGTEALFTTVYSGIDLAPYRQPVDLQVVKRQLEIPVSAPLVGAVGRLSAQKSPFDFVKMAAEIHRQRPDVHFVWIGAGPLETEARSLADSFGLEAVFHLPGQRRAVPEILRSLDGFVLPSRWEGFPLVVLEAFAAGVPVVATDILGTREAVLSGQSGLLVPVGEAAALAGAVLSILSDPALAHGFVEAGRARVETEFTRERMLQGVTRVYLDVIASRK